MEKVIDMKPAIKQCERKEKKDRLLDELEILFWEEPDIYHELCDFCFTRMRRVSQTAFDELRRRGLLERRDEIPNITNEVVYEATHGEKPFWQN